jgi:UDP-N-acetylglucosamine 2-epimerase (non-hydrolysing)
MTKKTVVTILGIRPDFARMAVIIKSLDEHFNHILIHTGQHFDKMLSDVFFEELGIREPDYNLGIGGPGKEHFHQLAECSIKIIETLRTNNIKPDIILFLGDSNSVGCAFSLKKEGYKIGHIEACMRSYDKRMLEEINRTVCDHCSDLLFVYHQDYKQQGLMEGLNAKNIYVVGNTIVEVCKLFSSSIMNVPKKQDYILMDIHRPENFKYKDRLFNIIEFAKKMKNRFELPIKMLDFKRTTQYIKEYGIDMTGIDLVPLMSYKNFLKAQYHSAFMISDSGTAQEEPALLNTLVIVPRDFTERPQSMKHHCSRLLNVEQYDKYIEPLTNWISTNNKLDSSWLGDGLTSERVVHILKERI